MTFSEDWKQWRARVDLDEYESRWDRLEAEGDAVHGEADLISSLGPRSVLDAGCGMGRVGIELHRRGIDVAGVDLDLDLLERARRRSPAIPWHHADLASLRLGRTFDVVALAGNVIPFVAPTHRHSAIQACADHLGPDGILVSGFSLRVGWPGFDMYNSWCTDAGLSADRVWSSWAKDPFVEGSDYVVTTHRAPPELIPVTEHP